MAKLRNYDRWFEKKYAVQLREFHKLGMKLQIHCDENDVYFLVKEGEEQSCSRILWAMMPVEGMSTEKLAEFSPKFFSALPSLHHGLKKKTPDANESAEHFQPMEEWGTHIDPMEFHSTQEPRGSGQSIFQ